MSFTKRVFKVMSTRSSLPRTRLFLMTAGVLLVIAMMVGAASAQSFTNPPNGTQFTLTGCRNTGQVPLYLNSTLPLVCDPSVYTTGNLQKGWNELDLVPYRLTVSPGASGQFDFYVGVDFSLDGPNCGTPDQLGTTPCGYDVITAPLLSLAVASDASCKVVAVGPQTMFSGLTGGTSLTAVRQVTISANKGVSCNFDWDSRLALGSHLFPGSSLQAYLFGNADFQTNKKTVPIPVKAILPQQLSKTMTASQGTDHTWTISKGVNPANLQFANTCDTTTGALTKPVTITINWSKAAAFPSGPVTLKAEITATNPAARDIKVSLTDSVYRGTTQSDLVAAPNPVSFIAKANTTTTVEDTVVDSTPTGTVYNDVAVAQYVDELTGVQVPGDTKAAASATVQTSTGNSQNQTATIKDIESISDTNNALNFTLQSMVPLGACTDSSNNSYTIPGGALTSLSCNSGTLSSSAVEPDSGTIILTKNVQVVAQGSVVTNGDLHDEATLAGSDGFSAGPAKADISISTSAQAILTVTKTIDVFPPGAPTQSFKIHVTDSQTNEVTGSPFTISFSAGDPLSKSVSLPGLAPDVYMVHEDQTSGWVIIANDKTADLTVKNGVAPCTGSATLDNKLKGNDLTVLKTATPAFTRTYTWAIKKDVDQTSVTTFPGNKITFNYTVLASLTGKQDSAWQVAGAITVSNPNFYDVSNVAIGDAVPGGSCSVANGGVIASIPANSSASLNYSCTFASDPGTAALTNTATASWDASANHTPDGSASGMASFAFTTPTSTVNKTVTVQDTFDTLGTPVVTTLGTVTSNLDGTAIESATGAVSYAGTAATFKYSHQVAAPAGSCTSKTNTAVIVETGANASQTVKVCGFSGELAPTQTTCSQYVTGTNLQQSGINYSNDGTGHIGQNLNPGVFFYFTRVIPASSGKQTISVTEANDGQPGNYNFGIAQAQMFDGNCNSLSATVSGNGSSVVTLSRSLQQGATYILAIKYSAKSIAGQPVVASTGCDSVAGDACYSYQTWLGGTVVDHNFNSFILTKGPVKTF